MEINEIIEIFSRWGLVARESDNAILVSHGGVEVHLSRELLKLNSTELYFLALQVGDLIKSSAA